MRCRFWLLALVVMLARCGTAEPSLQADSASITPSPIDVVAPTATLPAASVTPTLPPQPLAIEQLPLADLLFQPGDLPDATAGAIDLKQGAEYWLVDKMPTVPHVLAGIQLTIPNTPPERNYVNAYLYPTAVERATSYTEIIAFAPYGVGIAEIQAIGTVDQGIIRSVPAQSRRGSYDGSELPDYLIIGMCRMIVQISLDPLVPDEVMIAYAERIAQRIQAVDCGGVAIVPALPTITPAAPTPTPQPLAAITSVVSASLTTTYNSLHYAFANADYGWVTVGAMVYATNDAGATWQFLAEMDSPIRAIKLESPTAGLVETQLGRWHTGDGGQTWQAAPEKQIEFKPATSPCTWGSISMINQQQGWTLCSSEALNSRDMHKSMFHTSDGGNSWEEIADTPQHEHSDTGLPYSGYASGIYFLDEQEGWFGDDRSGLFKTQDGGFTWKRLPQIGFPKRLDEASISVSNPVFLSREQGVIKLEFREASTSYEYKVSLYRTDDGGQTWREIFKQPPPASAPTMFLHLFDARNGVGLERATNTLFTTRNSGATWHELSVLPALCADREVFTTDLAWSDRDHGWALGTCNPNDSQREHTLLATEDGGATWTTIAPLRDAADQVLDIHAVDSITLYRLHAAGQIMVSHDRGATWTAQGNIPAATAITFVSHDTGWALQNKQLLQTSDGGVTWHDVGLGYPVQSLTALPNGTVWVITDEPRSMDTTNYSPRHRLLHSTDAGRTWREVQFTEYGFLLPNNEADWSGWIEFADAHHGWIGTSLSSSATLVYTNDGGTAWFGMR